MHQVNYLVAGLVHLPEARRHSIRHQKMETRRRGCEARGCQGGRGKDDEVREVGKEERRKGVQVAGVRPVFPERPVESRLPALWTQLRES